MLPIDNKEYVILLYKYVMYVMCNTSHFWTLNKSICNVTNNRKWEMGKRKWGKEEMGYLEDLFNSTNKKL